MRLLRSSFARFPFLAPQSTLTNGKMGYPVGFYNRKIVTNPRRVNGLRIARGRARPGARMRVHLRMVRGYARATGGGGRG
jgi:hypothetical protein